MANRVIGNEIELQRLVNQILDLCGWDAVHFKPARLPDGRWVTPMQGKTAKGFPDNVALRRGRLVVAELKGPNAKLDDPDQIRWLEAFRLVPRAEVFVWRPRDIDEIATVLL